MTVGLVCGGSLLRPFTMVECGMSTNGYQTTDDIKEKRKERKIVLIQEC